ncbi:exported hypothetical protein [Thiomonas sp. CB2]|nr:MULTISPECIES: hypothetical protein [unclassified Thiomonas]CDW96323.1 exported hypothetical protein [Thiomonas sp. CB2]VDY15021.1 conserved exported protein of unknown function [Thiomonas sp. OC7]VDY06748.1 exported protein of unknown function [Thiomonas sp. Bio17B3]VDY09958.1 exported protein of unknown function [Thiomonas sp. Sup16B3]VDY11201.1 exported protein of unknown function [Thiomonas sp. Sup16B3]
MTAPALPVFALALLVAVPACAGVIGHREHDNSNGRTAGVEIPLAPVLGKALTRAGLPEAQALQPCAAGWPVSPLLDHAQARAWVAGQVRAACVVSATETTLANRLTGRVWPSADALQAAADQAARTIDLAAMRRACPRPRLDAITTISGDAVQAQVGQHVAYACGPDGVTIARDGAVFFGGGVIDGRQYRVGLEHGSSDKSSVGGAFLSP